MNGKPVIDFDVVQRYVTEHGTGSKSLLHGPSHWCRVERNGLYLATHTSGADVTVIRLFALFHDSMRCHDGFDQGHGGRGAIFMEECRGTLFQLDSVPFEVLFTACRDHTDVDHTDDPTIACCWDADRLDLPRVNKTPQPKFFSTSTGRRLVQPKSNIYNLCNVLSKSGIKTRRGHKWKLVTTTLRRLNFKTFRHKKVRRKIKKQGR